MNKDDTQSNLDVASEMFYSVRELAALRIPRFPDTERGWLRLVTRDNWLFREVKSKGRGGIRREYTPPPEVKALIDARQRGDLPATKEKYSIAPSATEFLAESMTKKPRAATLKMESPSAEWMLLCAVAIADADWLPKKEKRNKKEEFYLASTLYSLLVYSLGTDDEKWRWLLDHPEDLQHALRFVYALRTMEVGLQEPTKLK